MSLNIASGGTQALKKLSGIVPASDDYTCTFWVRVTNQVVSSYRNYLVQVNGVATYTRWAGIFSQNTLDNLYGGFDGDGSFTNTIPSETLIQNTWYPVAYVRSGANQSIYFNWKLLETVSESVAGATFTEQWLGNDTVGSNGAAQFKYFREWNKAKSLLELTAEWQNSNVVDTDSLWSDTPLIADGNDISGNARNWANEGTATFVSGDPFTDYNTFYFCNIDPPIFPDPKGGWDQTDSSQFLACPIPSGLPNANIAASETSATNPFSVQVFTVTSPPLAAQTITGDFNLVLSMLESNADANFFTKVYVYVTQGSSETLVRGVLLDYSESSGGGDSEWPTTATARALTSDQTLTPVAVTEGDHLVIEFGFIANNSTTSTRTGTSRRGGLQAVGIGSNYLETSVLAVGDTDVTTKIGYFWFSESIQLKSGQPLNLNANRAILIDEFPYSLTSTPEYYSADLYFVWPAVGESIKSAFSGTTSATPNYSPQLFIYIYTGTTVTDIGNSGTAPSRAWMFPAHDGDNYYFKISDELFSQLHPTTSITFVVVDIPDTLPVDKEGIIFIPDDRVSSNYEPLTSYVDPATGEILKIAIGFPVTENGVSSRISGNIIITGAESPYLGNVYFYDKDTVLLDTDTTTLSSTGQENPPVSESDNFFYAAQYVSGDGTIRIRRWEFDGTLDATNWDIPIPVGWSRVSAIAVSRDDTILYYSNFSGVQNTVKKWDLVNDLTLPDFYDFPGTEAPQDLLISTDGYIYIGSTDLTPNPDESRIRKFDTDANILFTIDLDVTNFGGLDHFALGVDDTESLKVWQQKQIGVTDWVTNALTDFSVVDGAQIAQLTNVLDFNRGIGPEIAFGEEPTAMAGIPNSCPLIILLNPGGPPPPPTNNPLSGIYKIVPNSFKATDTLWIALDPESTQEVAIPNPFIITGGIGN